MTSFFKEIENEICYYCSRCIESNMKYFYHLKNNYNCIILRKLKLCIFCNTINDENNYDTHVQYCSKKCIEKISIDTISENAEFRFDLYKKLIFYYFKFVISKRILNLDPSYKIFPFYIRECMKIYKNNFELFIKIYKECFNICFPELSSIDGKILRNPKIIKKIKELKEKKKSKLIKKEENQTKLIEKEEIKTKLIEKEEIKTKLIEKEDDDNDYIWWLK
jgi:hypothetical protein